MEYRRGTNSGQKISYKFKFLGGETEFSYKQNWNVGGRQSQTITLGSQSGVKVELGPGEGVIAELSASRGTMDVKVSYDASLYGQTAVNYDHGYKDHHYWALPIRSVMYAGVQENSIKSHEELHIGYYSSSTVTLRDIKTNEIMAVYETETPKIDFTESIEDVKRNLPQGAVISEAFDSKIKFADKV